MSKKPSGIQISRRQLLAMSAPALVCPFGTRPVQSLMASLVDGLIQEAQGASAPGSAAPRNYVLLSLPQAPPRWTWDLLLAPNGETLAPNAQIKTRFVDQGGSYSATNSVYDTVPYTVSRDASTLRLPTLWGSVIATPGGTAPMTELLQNMLFIRGVDMRRDGHINNNVLNNRPDPTGPSLNGLVADGSSRPIPAVGLLDSPLQSFASRTGVGQASVLNLGMTPSDPLTRLLEPFDRKAEAGLNRGQAMGLAIDKALGALAAYAKSSKPGAEALYDLRGRAEQLLKTGFGDVASQYGTLLTKYKGLIQSCATPGALPAIAGVSDQTVATGGASVGFISIDLLSQVNSTATDLNSMIQADTTPSHLAEGFALAEYLISNSLSSSVLIGVPGIENLHIGGSNVVSSTNDEHLIPSGFSLYINSFYYRAIASCLREFIASLKAKGMWSETVIHVGSEFNRAGVPAGTGSDHGFQGNSATILTGAIGNGPYVMGNTVGANPVSAIYPGDWGYGAPVSGIDGGSSTLVIGNVASTVAGLLRVQTPTKNNSPVLTVSDSGVVNPVIGKARNT